MDDIPRKLSLILKEKGIDWEVVDNMYGIDLEGLLYKNKLGIGDSNLPNINKVIIDESILSKEGSGLVHLAPAYGPEDFEIGEKNNLPFVEAVDEEGIYTEGLLANQSVREVANTITQMLNESNLVVEDHDISHSQGHCWRCKTDIIYRGSEQRFLNIVDSKERMRDLLKDVQWVPQHRYKKFMTWLDNLHDWCITRQRYWGTPLPIWKCDDCSSETVIGSKKDLEERSISDLPEDFELHRPWVDSIKIKCEDCGEDMSRVPDVLDVWIDSGCSSWASLKYVEGKELFNKLWPADLIIEGKDQLRGWFYALLGCSALKFDALPYKKVHAHSFVVDKSGRKMSKSIGNIITPQAVIDKYGIDTTRFYLAKQANVRGSDVKFDIEDVKSAYRTLNILWSSINFAKMYMDLDKFNPTINVVSGSRSKRDVWIISRKNSLIKNVTEKIEQTYFEDAAKLLEKFIIEDLSQWYIKLARQAVWAEEKTDDKLSCYQSLFEVFIDISKLLTPFTPHISEEIYQMLREMSPETLEESVLLSEWPVPEAPNLGLENQMKLVKKLTSNITAFRQSTNLSGRWPIKNIIIYSQNPEILSAFKELSDMIKFMNNLDNLEVSDSEQKGSGYTIVPNFSVLGPRYKQDAKEIGGKIKGLEVEKKVDILNIEVEGRTFNLTNDCYSFSEKQPENVTKIDSNKRYTLFVDTELTEEMKDRGYSREIIRRLQTMRSELDLDIDQWVDEVYFEGSKELYNRIDRMKDQILAEVRSNALRYGKHTSEVTYSKEWLLKDKKIELGLKT